ncbi:MAG: type II toxin-antitoxin system VapC family toxin [Anaerolineales bacterium]|jgi:tRNA(fMet)-specific endonuclease VapC
MKYMLDTNICIYLIKQQPREVIDKFQGIALGEIAISTVTVAEMMYGVAKSQYKEKNKAALQAFLAPLEMVDFDFSAAQQYGVVRAYLEKAGKPIGAYDLMIAAHALSLGLVLVSNNEQEFQRIPDLIVENWVKK